MTSSEDLAKHEEADAHVVPILVDNHRRFLSFVQARVGNPTDAEEILQAAFVRGVEAADTVRDDESTVAWFYRILRNGIIDHYRRRGTEQRALERLMIELPDDANKASPDVRENICACVSDLLPTLRPEQSEILRKVDLEDRPVHLVAEDDGITDGNARVRLHRARQALRLRVQATCGTCAEHGCLNCTCSRPGATPAPA